MISEERVKMKARSIDMVRHALTRKHHDRIFSSRYLFISAACWLDITCHVSYSTISISIYLTSFDYNSQLTSSKYFLKQVQRKRYTLSLKLFISLFNVAIIYIRISRLCNYITFFSILCTYFF